MTVYRLVRNSDTAHNKNVACWKIASTNATSFLAYRKIDCGNVKKVDKKLFF